MQSDHGGQLDLREIREIKVQSDYEVQSDHEGQPDLREIREDQLDPREIRETQVKQDLRGILDPREIREMLEPRLTWIILRVGSPQM